MSAPSTQVRRFRVPLAEMGYVQMIVDSYDGLAIVTAPDGARTEILEWWVAPGLEAYADALAVALGVETGLTPLPPLPG